MPSSVSYRDSVRDAVRRQNDNSRQVGADEDRTALQSTWSQGDVSAGMRGRHVEHTDSRLGSAYSSVSK